jgi:threonine aldolase
LFASVKRAPPLGEYLRERGVLINASPIVRLVTHIDVNRQQLTEVVSHWQAFLNR